MELDRRTKARLKELVNEPKLKSEKIVIAQTIDVFNHDYLFSQPIKVRKSSSGASLSSSVQDYTINFNHDLFEKQFEVNYDTCKKLSLSKDDAYRFFIFFDIFHEVFHIDQFDKTLKMTYPYDDLNRIYYVMIDYFCNMRVIDGWIYNGLHNSYFFERSADIFASKLLLELIEIEDVAYLADTMYMNRLFADSYILKKGKVISPVEKTMKYMGLKNLTLDNNVPFDVAFEHGLPITEDEYHYLFDPLNKEIKESGAVNSDLAIKRIKELTLLSK